MNKVFLVIIFSMFFSQSLFAQGDHISLGIGPSLIYGDNSGIYRKFKFKVQPAITLSINKQINEYIGLRSSIGAQNFDSGDYDLAFPKKIRQWGDENQAYGYKGRGYFADVMPVFTTNPNAAGMLMSSVQFYAGLGFGVMYVEREQKILKNKILGNSEIIDGGVVTYNETNFIPYIPIRTGVSTNLSGDWDFALEFVLMTTTNSKLDGNTIKDKSLSPDISGQIQFTAKWYFGPAW
ncbi:hypothetical protein LV84_01250 [Algoriphagus ratkowskyi]|uniref:Outer membrane protein with beta-barrel domain n=1 Tax=Algoriphagus ratkowskyi TaxID=57028 RepID=A0A2W7RL57_9BACT|nr:hypothetical protein [Algoriphagus ratkowskyi]PZX59220.1 hypothetical protein LV84_01250 [Algoriphagus ratkowskyi]TXD77497.1 hypothetical protein ESW18_11910 [Algoriphagus ratkowskyi]